MPGGSKKGERRGGRKKGTPNKATAELREQLAALNCDPLEATVRIARRAEKKGNLELAGRLYAELLQYVAPKRKAVEISGANGDDLKLELILNSG